MPRKKRKIQSPLKRIEFKLAWANDRDRMIWEYLEKLIEDGAAGEFIKQVVYEAIMQPTPDIKSEPATGDDLEDLYKAIKDEFVQIQYMIRNIKAVAAPSSDETSTEDNAQRSEAESAAKKKLLGLSFLSLESDKDWHD